MDGSPERRRYHPGEENVPLSTAVREAIAAHEHAAVDMDELKLYDHIDPDALDALFQDTSDVELSVQINLTNVTVGIWSDGAVDIRVSEKVE